MLQGEHSAILSTFIKLLFFIKIFILSILKWPFYTVLTVHVYVIIVVIRTTVTRHKTILVYFLNEVTIHEII